VKWVLEEGRVAAQVARDLGISEKTLCGWITRFKNDSKYPFVGSGNLKPEAQATRDLERENRELRVEGEILKKAVRIFTKDRKYDHRFDFSVQRMCRVLEVYRSGYYAWLKHPDSERKQRRQKITQRIHQILLSSRRLYGSPKIMRENGLKSRTVLATTDSKHNHPVHDNVLNQSFTAQRPNQVWM